MADSERLNVLEGRQVDIKTSGEHRLVKGVVKVSVTLKYSMCSPFALGV